MSPGAARSQPWGGIIRVRLFIWALLSRKCTYKKTGNSEGEGGFTIMEFWRHGEVMHFGISEGKGGLKYGSRPWLDMDIFWNYPIWEEFNKIIIVIIINYYYYYYYCNYYNHYWNIILLFRRWFLWCFFNIFFLTL